MNAKTDQLKERLHELADSLVVSPQEMDAFAARWRTGFHQYSFFNQLLIWWQFPAATLCAGYRKWQEKKRQVRAGEKGISILVPFFSRKTKENEETGEKEKVEQKLLGFGHGYVFDVSQTDGPPLDMGNTQVKGKSEVTLEEIIQAFPEFDWKIGNGTSDGWTDGKRISVSERANKGQMICTALHELAHIELGHQSSHKNDARTDKEIEAEATAYLVARCLGLDNEDSRLYIVNWAGNKEKLERGAGTRVLNTAQAILRRIEKTEPQESSADER